MLPAPTVNFYLSLGMEGCYDCDCGKSGEGEEDAVILIVFPLAGSNPLPSTTGSGGTGAGECCTIGGGGTIVFG